MSTASLGPLISPPDMAMFKGVEELHPGLHEADDADLYSRAAEVLHGAEELRAKLATMPAPLQQQLAMQSAGLRGLLEASQVSGI